MEREWKQEEGRHRSISVKTGTACASLLASGREAGGERVPGEDTAVSLLPHFTSALRHVGYLYTWSSSDTSWLPHDLTRF